VINRGPPPIELNFNVGEAAPGLTQLVITLGPMSFRLLIRHEQAEAIFTRALAEVQGMKRRVIIASPDEVPQDIVR